VRARRPDADLEDIEYAEEHARLLPWVSFPFNIVSRSGRIA
jgi:hypothetical protein